MSPYSYLLSLPFAKAGFMNCNARQGTNDGGHNKIIWQSLIRFPVLILRHLPFPLWPCAYPSPTKPQMQYELNETGPCRVHRSLYYRPRRTECSCTTFDFFGTHFWMFVAPAYGQAQVKCANQLGGAGSVAATESHPSRSLSDSYPTLSSLSVLGSSPLSKSLNLKSRRSIRP